MGELLVDARTPASHVEPRASHRPLKGHSQASHRPVTGRSQANQRPVRGQSQEIAMQRSLAALSLLVALATASAAASAQTANCTWYAETALKQQQRNERGN